MMLFRNGSVADSNSTPGTPEDTAAFFDVVYRRYKTDVFTFCLKFLGDFHEAEDCTQDVFIKAFRRFNTFREASSIGTWLYRISVNTCVNRKRKVSRRRNLMKRYVQELSATGSIHDERTPEAVLERRISDEIIRSAIAGLIPARRTVVILRDINGLSYDDIAEITNLKPGTLKSRIARGRRDLAKMLKEVLVC